VQLPASFKSYLDKIDTSLLATVDDSFPKGLGEPMRYVLQMPGKKIRPLMALFSSLAVGGTVEQALPAATAVELFHDFTLIHDDIMDEDEMRRGFSTVHVKYDEGTAILTGDLLIGIAYRELVRSPAHAISEITGIFTEALIKVCEGQALDKEFENRQDVSTEEYIDMIGKKTGWLIMIACSIGSICGGGSREQVEALRSYGYDLGLGFQIQDDLLDFIADEDKLGKQVGSDFRMDKKTYVALKYAELIQADTSLQEKYPTKPSGFESFADFQRALHELGLVQQIQLEADQYIAQALRALESVQPLTEDNLLYQVTQFLQKRQF